MALMRKLIATSSVVVIFLVSTVFARNILQILSENEDGICTSMVETQGYGCEEHKVTTDDGYILSLQRIPKGISGKTATKPPVLLQHGLLMDGITWLLSPPDESLAFILVDDGYDVWIANTRGTKYSQGHISLSSQDPAYWEWSWDELVDFDLPATFKYVHDQTGQKLHYVGHSLGTLTAFGALSENKLVDMLRSAALLSPIAYLGQIKSPLAKSASQDFIAEGLYWLGIHEFDPRGEAVVKLLEKICQDPSSNCSNLMNSFTGPNCCVNSSITDLFLEHEPQATATKNMVHIAQMTRKGTIEKFDYGSDEENKKHYGQPNPPQYIMSNIPNDMPLFLAYGGKDYLSDVNDVKILLNKLQDHDPNKLVVQYREDYAHADFVFGTNAKEVIYNSIMAFFKLN
ncbi:putative xyloglucan endotransglucosylase/hydrolase protein 2-like [Capsicum annuum]|nr:triacylglycerol lipase 2 [Capsicum annuum]KAF3662184.1 putative xyloglucan endotransglucosylase/hydrolase protein 2-like [Capsicum annuum]